MTARPAARFLTAPLRRFCSAPPPVGDAPGPPPLLLRLRSDLKEAMRAKDANRLSVLRSILAEVTNLSKTSNPIKKDVQLLVLLRKRSAMAKIAVDEFRAHQRPDLADKEELQGKILESYMGQVDVLNETEVRSAAEKAIRALRLSGEKSDVGAVLKRVMGKGGELEGKPVDRGELARLVKDILNMKE